jgi:hypothetical protein
MYYAALHDTGLTRHECIVGFDGPAADTGLYAVRPTSAVKGDGSMTILQSNGSGIRDTVTAYSGQTVKRPRAIVLA